MCLWVRQSKQEQVGLPPCAQLASAKKCSGFLVAAGDTQQELNGYGPAALLQEGLPAPR